MDINQEQAAFEELREKLISEGHVGQSVLMKDGQVIGFFATEVDAFAAGVSRFGTASLFLVDQILPKSVSGVSISWESGAMFVI